MRNETSKNPPVKSASRRVPRSTRARDLLDRRVSAIDDEFGCCSDLLFDDHRWEIRYIVVDTGSWFSRRRVLVDPREARVARDPAGPLSMDLRRAEIEDSPELDDHAPVSREFERRCFHHLGWSYYWMGGGLWGPKHYPKKLSESLENSQAAIPGSPGDLRSVREVLDYSVEAGDERAGYVDDFAIDTRTWQIRHVCVNPRSRIRASETDSVRPDDVTAVRFTEKTITVQDGTREG